MKLKNSFICRTLTLYYSVGKMLNLFDFLIVSSSGVTV